MGLAKKKNGRFLERLKMRGNSKYNLILMKIHDEIMIEQYIYMYVHLYVCIYIHMYIYIYIYMCTCDVLMESPAEIGD